MKIKHRTKIPFLLLVLSLFLISARCNRAGDFGKYNQATIEIAGKKLGGRSELSDAQGMLFLMGSTDKHSFWMKDVTFPIDIIWILDDKVAEVTHNVMPQPGAQDSELITYPAHIPVNKVLEVKSGWAATNGIKPGDVVKFDISE